MDLIAPKVREQSLRGDQDRLSQVQPVDPTQIKCRSGMARLSGAVWQQSGAELHRFGHVDRQPPHLTVVDPPELGLQPLAEGRYGRGRVRLQEAAEAPSNVATRTACARAPRAKFVKS